MQLKRVEIMKIKHLGLTIILFMVITLSCNQSNELNLDNNFNFIKINYISAIGFSDLMPAIPPDPINFSAEFEFYNQSESKTIDGFNVLESYVLNAKDDSIIGKIEIYPYPEILLTSGEKKIITFYKKRCKTKLFEVPCNESVYLKIIVMDKYGNSKELLTDDFVYTCTY
jgi:hypothetical protein